MVKTTVVIADDHRVVRHGLQLLLEAEPDFDIVGQASDGLEAIEAVERFHPDVLIVDVVMPVVNGIEVARRTRIESPSTKITVLSMYDNQAYVAEALQAGAEAYVLKRFTSDELVHAVRETLAGRRYLSAPLGV